MANDGDEIALPSGLDLEDSKAAFGIVEGDALDRAREGFEGRFLISLCRSKHLVHGACWEDSPGSPTVALDGAVDEVVLLRSHPLDQDHQHRPRGRLSARSKGEAGGQSVT